MNFDNKNFEEEIDFRKVKDNPIRWFGAVYPYFITVIVVVGLIYASKLNTINRNSIQPALFDSSKQLKELPFINGSSVKGIDIALIKSPSKEFMEKGKQAYTLTCSPCHGVEGKADGAASAALNPKPRNFSIADGWKNGRKFADIYKTVQEGLKGTAMTAYEFLPIEDKIAIVHYIRSLAADFPQLTDDEIVSLNASYGLTNDRVTPNQIPISKAINIIDGETNSIRARIIKLSDEIGADNSDAAVIFKKISTNRIKGLTQLVNNQLWKESPVSFVNMVANSGPKNGFCPRIAKFTSDEVTLVFNYLKSKI
jgi:hypothetical protein